MKEEKEEKRLQNLKKKIEDEEKKSKEISNTSISKQ